MTDQTIRVDDELFLGRLDEQDRFREVLHTVLAGRDETAPPFIFLIYGEGGMGKSQLTKRLYDIATTEPPFEREVQALRVDWELVRNHTPALRVAREQIHPEEVLDALHREALDRDWGQHFKKYQEVIQQRRQAEAEVAQALEREQSRYTELRDLGATGLAKLVRLTLPVIGQTGEDLSKTLLAGGIQLGAEQLAKARSEADQFLKARLQRELYDIYRQPHEQLARALGEGFGHVSQTQPLVLMLDTYEIVVPAADMWLRQVIKAAGPRVIWIISGRDNLAASRAGDRFVGYSAEFPRRLITWDIQELAITYVGEYLADRAPGRPPTAEEAAEIHRATLGVPLALRLAADLWAQGMPLTAITQGTPDDAPREELVRLMCERVLLHVEENEAGRADRRALYALAMQPRPDHNVLATLLRPADGAFDLHARLVELARHYSVVRLAGGARLHEAMADFVREYLLRTEVGQGDLVRELAERAGANLRWRRGELERDLFCLEERVTSEDWQQASLDLVHWLFWRQGERAAWRELVPRLVEGLGYDLDFSLSLLKTAAAFQPRLSQDGRRRLKNLQLADNNVETLLAELERLDSRGRWLADEDAAATAERQAILLLVRGRWQLSQGRLDEALQTCLMAEQRLPPETVKLQEQLGRVFYDLSNQFLWPEGAFSSVGVQPGLQAAQIAVRLDEQDGGAWYNLGVALHDLDKKQEAIAAYQQAIALDPKFAYPHHGLGNVYHDLGRTDEALAAFQQAIALDPKDAYPHHGLGNVYRDLGRYDEALVAYQQAIVLDPKAAYPHHGLGNVYYTLGRTDEALAAYQQAIALDPKVAGYHWNLGDVYRALGHYDKALVAYQQAIDLYPNFAYLHHGLGNVYSALGRTDEALAAYQQAIALDPKYAAPHNGLGNVYRAQGRTNEALAAYQQAITLDSKYAAPHQRSGVVYLILEQPEKALAAFRRAVELEPNEASYQASLASMLAKLGRQAEADKHLTRARELMAQESSYNKACIEAIAGNTEAALDCLAEALAKRPGYRIWARRDPDLESLRGQPRFEALLGNDELTNDE